MSDITYERDDATRSLDATPGDFVLLLKPRVMSLVLFTALAGYLLAAQLPHPFLMFASLLCIAVGAGASGALNMWYDADIDAKMSRTSKRPVPDGRLNGGEALAFGLVLSVLSVLTLSLTANWLAAGLLAFTIFFYVVIYTMWLKRWTPLNIVIGGAAGALPPIVGYAAATGEVSFASIVLFMIIFMWTPPHFWALALLKKDDYGAAGVPMLPNVAGDARTRLEILVYTALLAPLGVLPWFLGFATPVYGVVATLFGCAFIYVAAALYRERRPEKERAAAGRLFGFSILYLFVLFLTLVLERVHHFAFA